MIAHLVNLVACRCCCFAVSACPSGRAFPGFHCTVADLRAQKDQKDQNDQKDQKDDFRPARRPPQAPQACANAAPAPLRGEPLQCSKRASRTGSGVTQQRVAARGRVFPRFAPGAADRWRMPGAPAAGSWQAVLQHDCSRAQACAQATRPDQSRRREARKNRWCHWRRALRQSHARAARRF